MSLFWNYLGPCPYFSIRFKKKKKIELQVELDISNVEFYAYFST